jgi:hypothetical protein
MAKHWREMTPQEKADQLRDEMMVKSNQVSVLAKEIEALSQRLAVVEGKLKQA